MKTVSTPKPAKKAHPKEQPPQKALSRPLILRGLIWVAVVLALLIPSYIAISDYLIHKDNPANRKSTQYTAAILEGPSGNSAEYSPNEEGSGGAELFSILSPLIENGEHVSAIPPDFEKSYTLTLVSDSGSEIYLFYCATDVCDLYFEDTSGNCYRSGVKDASLFLNSTFAYELYPQSAPPVLTTAATDEIIPSEIEWFYRTQSREYTKRTGIETAADTKVYPIANDIGFTFSLPPSNYTITVTQNGTTHTYENIGTISLPQLSERDVLDVEITAIYEQSIFNAYYGSVIYRFRMNVVEAAKFDMVNKDYVAGGYLLLVCENVKNAEKLMVNVFPSVGTPVIFRRNGLVYAAIPAGDAGNKMISVTYGTISETLNLTIKATKTSGHFKKESELRGDLNGILSELETLIAEKAAESTDNGITPTGRFIDPQGNGATRIFGYGDKLTVGSNDAVTLPFELYRGIRDIAVTASGTVREIGTHALLGNYVILDHGCGLSTWYCGLSEVRVAAGDILAAGDVIGLAGTGGFGLAGTDCVMVITTLGETAISPDILRKSPYMY